MHKKNKKNTALEGEETLEKKEINDKKDNKDVGDVKIEEEEKDNVFNKKKIIIISIVVLSLLIIGILSTMFLPKITLNGDDYVKLSINNVYEEKGAKASIKGIDITEDLKVEGSVNPEKVGKYRISYIVKKGFITKQVVRVVEVVDDVLPKITLKGSEDVSICPNKEYIEEGYTALDNYDGDITSAVEVVKGEDSIVYTVFDSSKNKTEVVRKVKKEDKEKPVITLKGFSTKYVMKDSKYVDEGYTATDNCDDVTKEVVKTGSVSTSKADTYVLKYEVKDKSGNSSSVTRKVVVYDKNSPPTGINKIGVIYLTFDDGPSKSITPGVLKILKEKGVKATFFVVNKSNDLNYLIKQAYNDGHTIGLHSYTHNYKTIYSSSDAYFSDLDKISNKVKSIIGIESKIIRFPGGGSNTVSKKYSKGIMKYLTNEVINRGYHYFDWNVSSGDAEGSNSKTRVYNSVVKSLKNNRANIVLMHDFENNYKTLNALSDIIDYGYAKGYTFEAIDMTTPLVRHKVNN